MLRDAPVRFENATNEDTTGKAAVIGRAICKEELAVRLETLLMRRDEFDASVKDMMHQTEIFRLESTTTIIHPNETETMTRLLPGILAMATIVVASNVLVQFLFGNWLTWGAFTYPLAFLVTDVLNRVYGSGLARRVVIVGFCVGVICSLVASAFDATTLRIAVGSGTAFLLAQLIDVSVFNRLREGQWWTAPVVSSLVGSTVDTVLFFSIAFSQTFSILNPSDDVGWANDLLPLLGWGPVAPLWVSLAAADWGVKIGLALLALVPFRIIVHRLSKTAA